MRESMESRQRGAGGSPASPVTDTSARFLRRREWLRHAWMVGAGLAGGCGLRGPGIGESRRVVVPSGDPPPAAPRTLAEYVGQMRTVPAGEYTPYGLEKPTGTDRIVAIALAPVLKPLAETNGGSRAVPTNAQEPGPRTVERFRMGATPVTVAMWREYCTDTGREMPRIDSASEGTTHLDGRPEWGWIDDHPMVNVSYLDICGRYGSKGYLDWASRKCGFRLTLPTRLQVEYVARAGGLPVRFPWGSTMDPGRVWFSSEPYEVKRTAPVVRRERIHVNPYGISDLAGNVAQWTAEAAIHGGGWRDGEPKFVCGNVIYIDKDFVGRDDLGFRLCAEGR